jgi:hypothetical protein
MIAKTLDGIQFNSYKRSDLLEMTDDCSRIFLRLSNISYPETSKYDPPGFDAFLRKPWRYTPAPPTPPKKPRQKAPG